MRPKINNDQKREPRKRERRRGPRVPSGPVPELPPLPGEPSVILREAHPVSTKNMDQDALKVMGRLNRHGHRAFLVGGAVRDLYIGKSPKDYDIGTDAKPEEIRSLFRNSRIIGRRFKINHIYFKGGKIIELATFRSTEEEKAPGETTLAPDNTYGNPETDAFRRDLTINGLFYDLSNHTIVDYVSGISDLDEGIVRFIGKPKVRVQEDPVRMIRAIRHAARTGFSIEEASYEAICEFPNLLELCPDARLYEEVLKDFRSVCTQKTFPALKEAGLLKHLLPTLNDFADQSPENWQRMLDTFGFLDQHMLEHDRETPLAVIMSSLLVGNVPVSDYKACEGDSPIAIILRSMFSLEPFAEGSEERALVEESGGLKIHPEIVGRLRKLVGELLKPMGVSKKDCEEIEKLFIIRTKLFEMHAFDRSRGKIPHAGSLASAVSLCKFSAHTEWNQSCFARWKNARPAKRSSKRD